MNKDEIVNEQRKRFRTVLELLKKRGVSQKKICDKLNRTEDYLSSLKYGKIKYIPDEVLEVLETNYNVDPAYIRLDSTTPFFDISKLFEHFEKFVSDWETVKHGGKSYLYLTMDRNLYEFLLEVDNVNLADDSGSIDKSASMKKLTAAFSGIRQKRKYVLIPCDSLLEIATTAQAQRKQLSEVLDLMEVSKDFE